MSDSELQATSESQGENELELTEEQAVALQTVQDMCEASELFDSAVVTSVRPPYINIELTGGVAAEIWGKSGPGLDALQVLCNLVVARRHRADVRVVLDAGNYRSRREQALTERARSLANEVKERNQEAELEPLSAPERRIVHNALLDDPGVRTYSEGDEPMRRVIIAPAEQAEQAG